MDLKKYYYILLICLPQYKYVAWIVMKKEKKNQDAKDGAPILQKDYSWIAFALLAVIVVAGLSYGYTTVTEKNRLEKQCNEIASSPDLKYPTSCVPFTGNSGGGDYVDTRSDPMCKCTVDLGNGTSTVIDVRASK